MKHKLHKKKNVYIHICIICEDADQIKVQEPVSAGF